MNKFDGLTRGYSPRNDSSSLSSLSSDNVIDKVTIRIDLM